jgi:DNA polymerase IV
VGIKVRLDDFSTHTRARTLERATNDPDRVIAVAAELLRRFSAPRPVRLLGVRVAGLARQSRMEAEGSRVARGEQFELRI